MMDEPEAQRE